MFKGGVRVGLVAVAVLGLAALPVSSGAGAVIARASAGRTSACTVPGYNKPLNQLWKPDMKAALRWADTRAGDIEFAVREDGHYWGHRSNHQEWSASVVKAMLLAAYVDQPSVADRALDSYDKSLLYPMIIYSDNNAAQQVFNIVGQSGLQALANRVGMTNFSTNSVWGETGITAHDQTKFFLHIDRYIARRHRWYSLWLLQHITPSQRWGIGQVQLPGWKLYFKGGWGYGTGLIDSQVALLVRGCARVSLAVLTMHDGNPCCSHAYGKATLHGIFWRLLFGFPRVRKR